MQYFSYRAIDKAGVIHSGSVSATSLSEVDSKLRALGLDLIKCKPSRGIATLARRSLKPNHLIDFTFGLHQMLGAGLPLLESLKELSDAANDKRVTSLVDDLVDQIESGACLSVACSNWPQHFKPLYINMLKAGEESGRLVEVLSDLHQLLKWQVETRSKIKRVVAYPVFVFTVLTAVIGFVMTWLVPSLVSFIETAGGVLPWHTRWLISLSEIVSAYGVQLLSLIVVMIIGFFLTLRTSNPVRKLFDSWCLKIPLVGPILLELKLARFCRCASLMYESGINFIEILRQGESLVSNARIASDLSTVRASVVAGDSISMAFGKRSGLPNLLGRLIRVGETTGNMDAAFLQASEYYDQQSKNAIERLEQLIGPTLTVTVGSVLLWVVLSVIGPIYELVFSMQELM